MGLRLVIIFVDYSTSFLCFNRGQLAVAIKIPGLPSLRTIIVRQVVVGFIGVACLWVRWVDAREVVVKRANALTVVVAIFEVLIYSLAQ